MQLNPYLHFGGRCAEAFAFYEQHLGARGNGVMFFRNGPAADQVGPEMQDKVMHASLLLGDVELVGTDGDGDGCEAPGAAITGMHVVLTVDAPEEAENLYAVLAEGGTAEMSMDETFWAKRFGMVVDRFGVPWMINCNKTPE